MKSKMYAYLATLIAVLGATQAKSDPRIIQKQFGSQTKCDCCFIRESQTVIGNTIVGNYAYLDPLGSEVLVSYTKTDETYSENRSIIINNHVVGFSSTPTSDNINGVIGKLISELMTFALNQADVVVNASSGRTPIDIARMTNRIIQSISPHIEATIRSNHEVTSGRYDIERIIRLVRQQLKQFISSRVSIAVQNRSRPVFLGNRDRWSLRDDKPFINVGRPTIKFKIPVESKGTQVSPSTVYIDSTRSNTRHTLTPPFVNSRPIAVPTITSRQLTVYLQPIVLEILQSSNGAAFDDTVYNDALLQSILINVRPYITSLVRESYGQFQGSLTINQILSNIFSKYRTKIESLVREQILIFKPDIPSPNTFSIRLISNVATSVKPRISFLVRRFQASNDRRPTSQEVIEYVLRNLDADISDRVYQIRFETDADFNLSVDELIRSIKDNVRAFVKSLLPVVATVTIKKPNVDDTISRLTSELIPTITYVVRDQLKYANQIPQDKRGPTLTDRVITSLSPYIQETITTFSRVNPWFTVNKKVLLGELATALRPIILAEIRGQVSSSLVNQPKKISTVELHEVAAKIIFELKPRIVAVLRQELDLISSVEGEVVDSDDISYKIYTKLQSHINLIVQKYGSNNERTAAFSTELSRELRFQITNIITRAVEEHNTSVLLKKDTIDVATRKTRGRLPDVIKEVLYHTTTRDVSDLVELVISKLRLEIKNFIVDRSAELRFSGLLIVKYVEEVVSRLRVEIHNMVSRQVNAYVTFQTPVYMTEYSQTLDNVFGPNGENAVSFKDNDHSYRYEQK